jgi:hypothetical protein
VEGQHLAAVAGGALREDRYLPALPQARGDDARWLCRAARRLPRGMNTVSVRSHSQPMSGQSRTSALQTKAAGASALMTKMSSQEMWFATSRAGAGRAAALSRLQAHAEHAEQLARPALLQFELRRAADEGIDQRGGGQAVAQVQADAGKAERNDHAAFFSRKCRA